MRLNSFHPDVRQIFLTMRDEGLLTTYPRFAATIGTQAYEWLLRKVPTELLFNDLNLALDSCVAGANDAIFLAPGFYHDLADTSSSGALDIDIADVSIIGLGRGSSMPRIDFNHADSDFIIGAANIKLKNIRLQATVTGVKLGISVEAGGDYLEIDSCILDVETTTTDEFLAGIEFAAGANYATIKNCRIDQGLGGAASAIHFNDASVGHKVVDNYIIGDYSTGNIAGSTNPSTVLDIGRNILINGDGSNLGAVANIALNGNSTGIIYNNYCVSNLATMAARITAGQCLLFENYANETVGSTGTGGIIGTAEAND